METNQNGIIDVDKLRQNANNALVTDLDAGEDLYAHSQFKDRTLKNVLISDLNVAGPHRIQHSKDFDMTFKYIAQIDKGRLVTANKVS